MVCDRTVYRSNVQNVFFLGYMVGSIFFGITADKYAHSNSVRCCSFRLCARYGRRLIMSSCLLLTTCAGFICTFVPQKTILGFWPSYLGYTIGRFILACATRGVGITGFVLGNDLLQMFFIFTHVFSATELVGPKKKFLVGTTLHMCFAFGQLILSAFAYWIREWRQLTLALSIFTIPFVFLHL